MSNTACSLKVGDKFRLFKRGSRCKVTALKNGTVKFDILGNNITITGSFPITEVSQHT